MCYRVDQGSTHSDGWEHFDDGISPNFLSSFFRVANDVDGPLIEEGIQVRSSWIEIVAH